MSDFAFALGERNETTKTVSVTFTVDGLNYTRDVNASATETAFDLMGRVLEVGRGLLTKVALGVVKDDATVAAEPVLEPTPTEEAPADDAA
jgi:hypothetical protein